MVQRWNIALSAYDYSVQHRPGKQIPHADYLSRYAKATDEPIPDDSTCLLIQPLPVSRFELVRDTKRYFVSVISSLKKGWNSNIKRQYPQFYVKRDELAVTPDGLLCLNDRIVIPPTLRNAILQDLHSGHLGVDKMKSLARLTCWWPSIDADISRYAKSCVRCQHKIKHQPSQWIPWPVSTESWQRVHADYCGPFLNGIYALVVIDSYSKWPEVFFTKTPTAEFTMHALRKVFSREGVPLVLVTDNGSHFSATAVTQWLHSIGCKHLFTAPRHPCSNGQAENFIRTLKSAVTSFGVTTFQDLEKCIDNFLLQYRNCKHSTTKETPSKLFKGRSLRSNLLCLDSSEVTYFRGNYLRPSCGIVLKNLGNRMLQLMDVEDLSIHRRHLDQIRYEEPGDLVPISSALSENTNIRSGDPEEDTVSNTEVRRSERLQQKPRINYKSVLNSRCGECDGIR